METTPTYRPKHDHAGPSRGRLLGPLLSLAILAASVLVGLPSAEAVNGCPCTIFPASSSPKVASVGDTTANELGVKFRADSPGIVSGVRFYKGSTNTGTHVAHLWSSTGTKLAEATFVNETATGWQEVRFSSPVSVSPGQTYIASYYAPKGRYAATQNAFATAGVDSGPLHALRTGVDGPNGVYRHGGTGFPNSTWKASNYWVDVVYDVLAAPAAPASVTATLASNTSATVTWAPSTGATSYTLERSLVGSGVWTTAATTSTTSSTVSGLAAGTSYSFRVRATGPGGTSAPSAVSTDLTTPAPPTAPGIPIVSNVTSSSATLTWTAVPTAISYSLQRASTGAAWATVATGPALTADQTGLAPQTAYQYRVVATNSVGSSPASATVTVTTLAPAATCAGVTVPAGGNIQNAINANPNGTTICLAPGTHRLTAAVAPKTGTVLKGSVGTILNGSVLASGWVQSGTTWYASGLLPAPYAGNGSCEDDVTNPCRLAEEVFIDDTHLTRVMSLAAVRPGTFFEDYTANRVYVGDNPTGRKVEVARTPTAISSGATDVVVEGLVVEKFATAAQRGAVVLNGQRWTVRNNEIRFNHGAGAYIYGSNSKLLNNYIHHNGQMGAAGFRVTGNLVEGNEFAYNNTDGFWIADWEAGGYKSTHSSEIVRNNNVHHNKSVGLWFDIDDKNVVVEGNTIRDNAACGIRYEISYDGIIRNNTVTGNGLGYGRAGGTSLYYGGSINVNTSTNVEVYGNTISGNLNGIGMSGRNRGSGDYGTYDLRNVWVHDNTTTLTRGTSGLVQNTGSTDFFTAKGNRFTDNTYTLPTATGAWFTWMNGTRTKDQWRGYGQDPAGTFAP